MEQERSTAVTIFPRPIPVGEFETKLAAEAERHFR